MKITIKAIWSGRIVFEGEYESLKHAVLDAVKKKVNLSDCDLSGSNLSGSNLSGSNLSGSNLSGSNLSGSNLSDCDLRGSNLRGSNLRGSNLSDCDLSGSNLSGSNLSGCDLRSSNLSGRNLSGSNLSGVPEIKNIHQAVYAAASNAGALDMGRWHVCETTHCRAGWVVTLAGAAGAAMEFCLGTPAAAALIYLKSDPNIGEIPDFYTDNETAMADMKRLAELEAKMQVEEDKP